MSSLGLLSIVLLAVVPVAHSQITFGSETVAINDATLVVFSGNANGGALYVTGTTIHNGQFTNTDFTTVAGR